MINGIVFSSSLFLFIIYLYKEREQRRETATATGERAAQEEYQSIQGRIENLYELLSIAEARAERAKAKLIEDSKLKEAIPQKHLDRDLKAYEQAQKQVIAYRNQIATAERRAAKAIQVLQ